MTSEEATGALSVLHIPAVSTEDGGRYLCSAELDGITVTTEAYLNVVEGVCVCVRDLGRYHCHGAN